MIPLSLSYRIRHALINRLPGQVVVQITDRCNARCPQCGMRVTSDFKRKTLDRESVYRTIDAAARRGVKAISFTGGEPMLMMDDLCDYMTRAGEKKIPFIRTGTNGYLFSRCNRPDFRDTIRHRVEQLAATPVRNFWISLDSLDPEVHDRMRGFDHLSEGIEKALPLFHEAGVFPSVNLGINRNLGGDLTRSLNRQDYRDESTYEAAVYTTYSRAFSLFYERVIQMGFTIVNACYPMSVDPDQAGLETVYQASAVDHVVRFSRNEKKMIFKALSDTIKRYRHRIRIFSPRTALNALIREYGTGEKTLSFSAPCQGGINYLFVDARTGDVFPCGFRGHDNLGKPDRMPRNVPYTPVECRQCDWECFRDPSELTAPVLDLVCAPLTLVRKLRQDPDYLKRWATDLGYYRACDYFNGRTPPRFHRLRRFAPGGRTGNSVIAASPLHGSAPMPFADGYRGKDASTGAANKGIHPAPLTAAALIPDLP